MTGVNNQAYKKPKKDINIYFFESYENFSIKLVGVCLKKEAFNMFTNLSLKGVDEDHCGVVESYLEAFMHDNALNPLVFPSLR